jgi:hypothetical protein
MTRRPSPADAPMVFMRVEKRQSRLAAARVVDKAHLPKCIHVGRTNRGPVLIGQAPPSPIPLERTRHHTPRVTRKNRVKIQAGAQRVTTVPGNPYADLTIPQVKIA